MVLVRRAVGLAGDALVPHSGDKFGGLARSG
jgi:hypothetical protein